MTSIENPESKRSQFVTGLGEEFLGAKTLLDAVETPILLLDPKILSLNGIEAYPFVNKALKNIAEGSSDNLQRQTDKIIKTLMLPISVNGRDIVPSKELASGEMIDGFHTEITLESTYSPRSFSLVARPMTLWGHNAVMVTLKENTQEKTWEEQALECKEATTTLKDRLTAIGSLADLLIDIRNPLTALRVLPNEMYPIDLRGQLRRRRLEFIKRKISESVDDIHSMVSTAIDLTRLALETTPKKLDVKSLYLSITNNEEIKSFIQSNKVKLITNKAPEGKTVYADQKDLLALLGILISRSAHALRGSYPIKEIRIYCKTTPKRAIFYVIDNGEAIPEDQQSGLFSLVPDQKKHWNQTGFNLFVVRGLAIKNRGDLKLIKTKPGWGSNFAISFPLGESWTQ